MGSSPTRPTEMALSPMETLARGPFSSGCDGSSRQLLTSWFGRTTRCTSCAVGALGTVDKGCKETSGARWGPDGTQDAGGPQIPGRSRPPDVGSQRTPRCKPVGSRGASRSGSPAGTREPRAAAAITRALVATQTGACPARTARGSRIRRPVEHPSARSSPEDSVRRKRCCRSPVPGPPSRRV